VVSDATCVFEPMVGSKYEDVQAGSLEYLSTFDNSKALETSELL
jgi:hypothetical protein